MLIVDAYNVLHTTGVLGPDLAGLDLQGLVRLVGLSRYRSKATVLVCDGHFSAKSSAGARIDGAGASQISVLYAGAVEADEVIETLVVQTHRTQRALIVSSDRRVQAAAGRRKLGVLASAGFLRQLERDFYSATAREPVAASPRQMVPLDKGLVARWLEVLGMGSAPVDTESERNSQLAPSPELALGTDWHDALIADLLSKTRAAERGLRKSRPDLFAGQAESAAPVRARRRVAPAAPPAARPPARDAELEKLLAQSSLQIAPADLDMHRWLTD